MYVAGIMNHFSDAPKMELIVWGSTMAIFMSGVQGARSQLKTASSKSGNVKSGSTGPLIWTSLAFVGHSAGLYLLPIVYWSATASNGLRQPEWMTEYALPLPPDIFGVDGVIVGRTVGLLGVLVGAMLSGSAVKALGDQFCRFGIREKPRLVDHGPYACIRHPIYAANIIMEAFLALAYWSYVPLYFLPFAIGGCLLKVPIEEGTILRDPELGNEYKVYKIKVPYRIIPYIW